MNSLKVSIFLPKPTIENPFVQVDYIFNLVAETKRTDDAKSNYRTACTFYKKFLASTNNYDENLAENSMFFLEKHWDSLALVKVANYIKVENRKGEEGYLTSHSIATIFSSIRKTMEYALIHDLLSVDSIINVSLPSSERETDEHEAYSEEEELQILNALSKELMYVELVLSQKGYEKTDVGQDPRIKFSPKGIPKKKFQAPPTWGWKCFDNVRWYFENEMNCEPLMGTLENRKLHNSFFQNCTNKYKHIGGLPGIYRKWGVTPLIDADLLMPLAVELTMLTGLNPSSLWDLTIDCYGDSHPLTNKPFLKYYKGRSDGNKVMSLNIYDRNTETKLLKGNEASRINEIIQKIKTLTQPVREQAPSAIQEKLFLFQSNSQITLGKISVINDGVSSTWRMNFIKKHGLKNSNGEDLKFNLVRFRPTKILKLINEGVDVFQIQHELGHGSVATTLKYLSRNRMQKEARKRVYEAIETIQTNCAWAEEQVNKVDNNDSVNNKVMYRTIVCDCKNPFQPPKNIKVKEGGKVCSQFNMCLLCSNVIIMKHHLPQLYQYGLQIKEFLKDSEQDSLIVDVYRDSLDVIDSIFDNAISEFTEGELEEAKRIGENMNVIIDATIYKPNKGCLV